jgi:predicted transcriptional regulator
MGRKRFDELGSLQQAVMEVIWQRGEATVGDVRAALRGRRPAYTTVLSVLQKLEKAGWVAHRTRGRAYVYAAIRSRRQEGASSLRKFVDSVFRGDPILLFEHLIDDERLSEADLRELRKMIELRRKERCHGSSA